MPDFFSCYPVDQLVHSTLEITALGDESRRGARRLVAQAWPDLFATA